jgi:hypothetical protein
MNDEYFSLMKKCNETIRAYAAEQKFNLDKATTIEEVGPFVSLAT